MSVKLYRLYCEICNWKLITDGSDEAAKKLVEIKTAPVPTGYPKLDDETKQLVTPPSKRQVKKFRCPKCGRAVRAVKIDNVQTAMEDKNRIRERAEQRNEEDWSIGRKEGVERLKVSRLSIPGVSSEIREGDSKIPE